MITALKATFLFLGSVVLIFTAIILAEIIIAMLLHIHDEIEER